MPRARKTAKRATGTRRKRPATPQLPLSETLAGATKEPESRKPPEDNSPQRATLVPAPGKIQPLSILEITHGQFPQVQRLNPDFQPGMAKLKVTLKIPVQADLPQAGRLLPSLSQALPTLLDHRCCGTNSLGESFFRNGSRTNCASPESDNGVDIAHLVEHVIIDVQHFVARMRICSGVTCAYIDPEDQYDVFVESPDETVGRTCAVIAISLMSDLLDGFPPDPSYLCVMDLARLARDHAGLPVDLRTAPLERSWGKDPVHEATAFLQRQGFLKKCEASFNFSGSPLLAFIPDSGSSSSLS
jgi:hypothetical protein